MKEIAKTMTFAAQNCHDAFIEYDGHVSVLIDREHFEPSKVCIFLENLVSNSKSKHLLKVLVGSWKALLSSTTWQIISVFENEEKFYEWHKHKQYFILLAPYDNDRAWLNNRTIFRNEQYNRKPGERIKVL